MQLDERTEIYELATRAAEQGALDGASNLPEPHATRLSPTELNIRNMAQDDLDQFGAEQIDTIRDELADITERASKIPFVIRRTLAEFRVIAEGIVQEADQELIDLYSIKLERESDYRLFRTLNELRREAAPARSLLEAWSYFVLMLVMDGSLNAYFFKDVGSLGLADGFLIAAIIAGCNIALGFMIGWGPLRYFAHRYKLHLLWAVPVFVLLVALIASFNWGVAHYRDLVHVNKQAGLKDVWAMLRTDPFGMLSFPSYLMALIGMGVAVYSCARAYIMFDSYPWYGWVYKRRNTAQGDFLEEAAKVKGKIQTAGEKFVHEAARDYEKINNEAHSILADYDKVSSRYDDYEARAQIYEEACNAALYKYRERNVAARDKVRFPPPHYFDQRVVLRRRPELQSKAELTKERSAFAARVENLRLAQEELARGVPRAKLELLSADHMNARLESITQVSTARQIEARHLEDDERAAA